MRHGELMAVVVDEAWGVDKEAEVGGGCQRWSMRHGGLTWLGRSTAVAVDEEAFNAYEVRRRWRSQCDGVRWWSTR
ncbi:hypothetical protein E2562_030334 [Oryza meyeriana var. granulata]|uniref:Uncharacterized protein n=1 Tax=Oryza meyeriana var. granulata TaxID=110450 RepID=A0A6G1FDY9_9ORYZ|nr:hypothetical protein E2562_030334 [Oryza meyeriana var. granulata]